MFIFAIHLSRHGRRPPSNVQHVLVV
jgi:hypothetical protein